MRQVYRLLALGGRCMGSLDVGSQTSEAKSSVALLSIGATSANSRTDMAQRPFTVHSDGPDIAFASA